MHDLMYCWPTKWLDAAVTAGLAIDNGDGLYYFGSDEMRDKLVKFAQLIYALGEAEK